MCLEVWISSLPSQSICLWKRLFQRFPSNHILPSRNLPWQSILVSRQLLPSVGFGSTRFLQIFWPSLQSRGRTSCSQFSAAAVSSCQPHQYSTANPGCPEKVHLLNKKPITRHDIVHVFIISAETLYMFTTNRAGS